MHKLFFLLGAAAVTLPMQTAHAQSRDGGGYVFYEDVYVEEEPPVETGPAVPAPTPVKPAPVVTPPLPPREDIYSFEDKALDAVTSKQLETFSSESAFRSYLKKLEAIKDDRDYHWSGAVKPIIVAASMQDADPPACANPEDCPAEDAAGEIVTTASRVSSPNITNVQAAGVDEGDIVKQIGDYFLILQDGRIFAINTNTMQLTDRVNVYRPLPASAKKKYSWQDDFEGADWYDEMLVQDDHILITAYSYEDSATEFSIFKLDQKSGKVTPQGVFLISSDDYYDSDNYATRIVGDRLVVYTPYSLEQFEDRDDRPVIRRWLPYEERQKYEDEEDPPRKQLFGARDVFKPVLRTSDPTIHTVSVCPLGNYKPGDDLSCRTTGFVGPASAEMYVSPKNVYLWNTYDDDEADVWSKDQCEAKQLGMPGRKDTAPAALFRMNVRSGDASVAGVNGAVFDQFSMEEQGDRFYALSPWKTIRCDSDDYDNEAPTHVAMLSLKDKDFGDYLLSAPDRAFTPVPVPQGSRIENRFVGDWLVYGGRTRSWWWSDTPDEETLKQAAENSAIAVPIHTPKQARKVALGHSIVRLERLGDDAVLNGYRQGDGLNVSLLKLGKDPRISSSAFLPRRFESESRSHAFNGTTDLDGSGIMGIPTTLREEDSDRYSWWSGKSDLSFLTLDIAGQLAVAGELEGKTEEDVSEHEGYKCDVSCIDWYGNARPIFTRGRIFGLMGTTLVEAKVREGRINEIARVDLTAPIGTKAAIAPTVAANSPAN
jgi:Beta propeller domain